MGHRFLLSPSDNSRGQGKCPCGLLKRPGLYKFNRQGTGVTQLRPDKGDLLSHHSNGPVENIRVLRNYLPTFLRHEYSTCRCFSSRFLSQRT